MNNSDIDVIIPWVDGNDPEWQKVYREYIPLSNGREKNGAFRFRDWDNLQYLFRGIEKFMPWVRKVHLVTCGQKPSWLNLSASKLNFVTHEDFIPKECLPTFSVRPIELNIHRIPGLADKFIYFNDDFFVLKPMKPSNFFRKGLPVDIAALDVLQVYKSRCLVMANNTRVINNHFRKSDAISRYKSLWLKPSYGKHLFKTVSLLQWPFFPGFQDTHLPQPFLKSTFEEVWSMCGDILEETSKHKFRDISDVNQSLMRYWQIASGNISPYNVFNYRKYFLITDKNIDRVVRAVSHPAFPLFILNDSEEISDFEATKEMVRSAFEKVLPEKSSFEI
jgi:hypothetical protein